MDVFTYPCPDPDAGLAKKLLKGDPVSTHWFLFSWFGEYIESSRLMTTTGIISGVESIQNTVQYNSRGHIT